MSTQKAPSFVQTSEYVKTTRPYVMLVELSIPAKNLRKDIPKSRGHRHSWNRKACFVCKSLNHLIKNCDYYEKKMVQKPVKNHAMKGNHQHYARMTHSHPTRHVVLTVVLTRSRLVLLTAARHITTAVPQTNLQHQRPTKHDVNKAHSPIKRPINHIPSPKNSNFHQKVTTVKANQGNPQHALKDKGVTDSGFSRYMTRNISYLSDFEEINRGYVAFGGNPKSGKITGKDSECIVLPSDFKLPDENHFCGMKGIKREYSVARTPQQNGIAERKNRTLIEATRTMLADSLLPILFWAEAINTACYVQNSALVTKPHNKTPYELLIGRTPSIGFIRPFGCLVTILNTLDPLGKFDRKADEGFLVGYSKPKSAVHVSISNCDKTKKHDDKTKREAKGKSPVELSIGFRDLRDEFEEFSDNNTNGVNAASTSVTAVGPNSTNSTNTFSAVGPFNNAVSLNFELGGKSSFVDPSQYPDDPDMPSLEDITYSDDEEDVGAEADFSNLETNITVSPIPTTRVHKDHPVTQIIDLPKGKRAIGSKWVFRNKKDERGKVIRNKDRLVAHGPTQEEGIDYEEVFALVARIEAISLFLAYASFMGFMVYQMDVKTIFLYGTIEEELYVCQPLGFEDPNYPDKVYKVVKALYVLHQAPKAWKFGLTDGKSASTPIDTEKTLLKDPDGEDVDIHTYRSMIGSLMYLTSSRSDIMLAVCAYSSFNLVAYSDSDYAGASLDRKSTTGGCQFLGCRLISWQCKKKTVVATSSTEAEYVAAASCCHQVSAIGVAYIYFDGQFESFTFINSHTLPLIIQKHNFNFSLFIIPTIIMALTFAESHNMIAFLTKSDASEGFEQIINFLNAHVIQYALMVNPTIYVSCIKQFWTSVSIKKSNDVVRLQALIDKKKVIITEDSIRQAFRLDDADSLDCLPNKKFLLS
uniref:Integrase catalytic domain-containing protein n=1 Tax=Tanacetum cinerariifolium TaxID=118510 RepID=A0A6L2N2Y5_TANCI|nr:hypothetical protein [Tanacetum cinerariifolium]